VRSISVLALAVAIDLVFGEPPNQFHPVAWIGGLYARGRACWLGEGTPRVLLVTGGALTVGVAALAAGLAALAAWITRDAGVAGVIVEALVLKATLSLRGLAQAAGAVGRLLAGDDLGAARAAVGAHLVSRPTEALDAPHVASAAIESVAENLTDAIVAPAFFFLVLGLPGAVAYRAINTADAMLGYRQGALEHFGKVAARLDDLLNVVPARIAGPALVLAAALAGENARGALTTMWRQRRLTASPNAGWTMAAMAGGLGLVLEKPGTYRLGAGRVPGAGDVRRSVRVMLLASAISLALMSLVLAAV
jgi:adenosylcobinamide-phosphate synthase